MVMGELPGDRRFWVCFESDSITSGKTIALAESGTEPSLLESFLIDEKRINLALLQSRLLQRLNGQVARVLVHVCPGACSYFCL